MSAFCLWGGSPEQVEACKALTRQHGVAERFRFTGFVQPQLIPAFIDLAEVLVSPRLSGTNSPQDLLLSAIGSGDRRHAPHHPHPDPQ